MQTKRARLCDPPLDIPVSSVAQAHVLCSRAGTTRIIGDEGDAEKELDCREIVEDIKKAEEKIADAEKTDDKVADADKDAQLKNWVASIRMIGSHCTAASLIFHRFGWDRHEHNQEYLCGPLGPDAFFKGVFFNHVRTMEAAEGLPQ